MRRFIPWAGLLLLTIILSSSCGTTAFNPLQHKPARTGEHTPYTAQLKKLPPPKDPLLVAVYQFRDQTGQYKPTENGAGFSTAVTQGGATILQHTLRESGWFAPIERENIGDLLNERKIIRSTRQQYGVTEELPALLYAGVLLEGGIISYDANVITGGAGLRYFGTGGSSQYRQDRVTVYLRAVSVSNGKVMKTVYASKMILSQAMDGGIFRFVSFQRLLEAETGFTYNEPSELAVTEAIEKAVEALIIEGIEDDLWQLKDPSKKKELLKDYRAEKLEESHTDVYGKINENRRRTLSLDARAGGVLYNGDYARAQVRENIGVGLTLGFSPSKALEIRYDQGVFATAGGFSTPVTSYEFNYRYRYLPYYRFSSSIFGGAGLVETDFSSTAQAKLQLGLGMEYFLGKNIALSFNGSYHQMFSDNIDAIEQGTLNDSYYRANLGLHFYFGKKLKSKKKQHNLVKADRAQREALQDF